MMLTDGRFRGFPNDGAVGHSILGPYAVEIDYGDSLMTLYDTAGFAPPPGSGWTAVDLTFPQRPTPWMRLGVRTAGEPAAQLDVYIDFASREAVELLERPVNRWTQPAVTLGPFTLRDVEAQVIPAEVRQGSESGADAVIGSGLFREFDLIFDYAHRKLWLRRRA